MRLVLMVLASMLLVACPGPSMPMVDGSVPGSVHVVFDPPATGPIDFADVPFPDDLYMRGGTIEIGAFPAETTQVAGEQAPQPEMISTMREAFHDLDGFGTTSGVFFRVDGDLDPSSLPATPADSLAATSSVFMIDAGSASPDFGDKVPVEVHWDAARRLLVVRPWYGHALHEGRTYAAVVTSAVRAMDGSALGAMPRFASIRDATSRPSDPIDAAAYGEYNPVLGSTAVTRSSVVGLAVFHVQQVSPELDQARSVIRDAAPPALTILRVASGTALDDLLGTPSVDEPGTDVPGGVQHSHIGTLIDGTFPSPSFTSSSPYGHGPWQHDASGALVVQGTNTVWMTVALPPGDVAHVPVVVFQHGLGSDRSAVFAIADALCAEGFAVAAIDIPFHGMRAQGHTIDTGHRFGSGTGPDLYGDAGGTQIYVNFVGVTDTTGPYVAFHPSYPRDTLRQSAIDVMALVNALDRADWSAVGTMGGPTTLGFSDAPIGFVGVSLGGIIGTTFVTGEPRVGAAVLNVTGGELTNLVAFSSSFNASFLPILLPDVGIDPSRYDATSADTDYRTAPPRFLPEIALYQTLLDRGDSMSFAPVLASQPKNVLFQMAFDDETVPNQATESLARAAEARIVAHMPRYSDLEMVPSPLASNLVLGSMRVTRGLTVFDPATHGLLSQRMAEATVMHPPVPPFTELASPTPVMNPVDAAVTQMVHFLVTFRSGAAEITQ
jgi:alpha-beta hydrolase superfamily lysophospholipase